jgi:pimeloyl-ACP methyl ester carboxylesterase
VDVRETRADPSGDHPAGPLAYSDPFEASFDVPVAGGALRVARAGPPPEPGGTVVLALHGMSGTHMVYRTVARGLSRSAPAVSFLAPDLRGRGHAAELPEPYGIAAHVEDLLAVLDHVGVERAILVGHSMGCNVAARLAADHPERAAAVLLLDGGLPIREELDMDDDEVDHDGSEPPGLFDRFYMTFATADEYLAYWRTHPGLKPAWDEDVDAFVGCDFVEEDGGVRCLANLTAILTDVRDLMFDRMTWTAVTRLRQPVLLMRAERGMYDDDPVIPLPELEEFRREHPHVSVEMVPDANHFTLVLGGGQGPRRVVATLAELATVPSR